MARPHHPLVPRGGHHRSVVLLASLLASAIVFLNGCGDSEVATEPPPPFLFIGIDGAEWAVIDALVAAGEMPHVAALRERGAWGHLINTGPLSSPVAWTTYSTGHFGRRHGILDFVYPYTDQAEKRPVNALDKREPAVWNIASALGRTVSVLGYFVTHPAEPINGVMISDRATQGLPGAITPAEAVADETVDYWRRGAGRDALLARFFPWYADTPAQAEDAEGLTGAAAARAYVDGTNVLRILFRDGFIHAQTLEQLKAQPDVLVTYYRSPDVMAHTLWKFHDDSDFEEPADPNLKAHLGRAVTDAYRMVDEFVGEVVAAADPESRFLLVSDHGMGSATGYYIARRARGLPVTGNHRTDGIVLAAGPGIEPGEILEMNSLDVMPTMMALAGLPVSDELPGEVRMDLFAPDALGGAGLVTVPRYAASLRPQLAAAEIDAEAERDTMETLQGLGYIGGDVSTGSGVAQVDVPVWDAEPRLFASALVGEAIFDLLTDDQAALAELFGELRRMAPEREEFFRRQLGMRGRALLEDVPLTPGTRERLQGWIEAETPEVDPES